MQVTAKVLWCCELQSELSRYRAKIVRHDFIQLIEDGGRWEQKQQVQQQCDDADWGYFNATLCSGETKSVHAPAELDEYV